MPLPILGVAVLESPIVFPANPLSVTRGALDNFAFGGGTSDTTGQTATYGGAATTLVAQVARAGFGSAFGLLAPPIGAQNWVLAGAGFNSRPAVMTFSGVNATTPIRGATVLGDGYPPGLAVAVTLPTLTADEISVAYVSWNSSTALQVLTATGATTIRAQVSGNNGTALMTSTSNVISFAQPEGMELRVVAAILTGDAGAAPTVSTIAPTSGPVGTQVTFTGTNLTGTSAANVNGTAMTGILNDSATQVRATVGAGSTTGATGLTATGGSVTGGPTFTVTATPVLTSLEITNTNVDHTLGVALVTMTVRAVDQFGATFLGTVPAGPNNSAGHCGVLPVSIRTIDPITEAPFVDGVATFALRVPVEPSPPPGLPVAVLRRRRRMACSSSFF